MASNFDESQLWQLKGSCGWQHIQKYLNAKYYDWGWWYILFEAMIARTITNTRTVLFQVGKSSIKQFLPGPKRVSHVDKTTKNCHRAVVWAKDSSGGNNTIHLWMSEWRCTDNLYTLIKCQYWVQQNWKCALNIISFGSPQAVHQWLTEMLWKVCIFSNWNHIPWDKIRGTTFELTGMYSLCNI